MNVAGVPAWSQGNDQITLWHGCLAPHAVSIQRNLVDLAQCRPRTDFGQGFYVTTVRELKLILESEIEARWATLEQVNFRINWLLSLDAAKFSDGVVVLTQLGVRMAKIRG